MKRLFGKPRPIFMVPVSLVLGGLAAYSAFKAGPDSSLFLPLLMVGAYFLGGSVVAGIMELAERLPHPR